MSTQITTPSSPGSLASEWQLWLRDMTTWPLRDRALLGWAVVVAVAMLSYFVHTVETQIQRGHELRAQLRAGGLQAPTPQRAAATVRLAAAPANNPGAAR